MKTTPIMIVTKKHISDYDLKLVGSTYFNGHPGNPASTTLNIPASKVDNKGFFLLKNLKDI